MTDLSTVSRRAFMVMPLALLACKPRDLVLEIKGLTMGTTYNVVAIDRTRQLNQIEVQSAIEAALDDVNRKMSNWDPRSEISQFNAQPGTLPVDVSPDLAHVMDAAQAVHLASDGRFDTTIGPLIELWGFGASGQHAFPNDGDIAAVRAASGHQNALRVEGTTMQKTRADAQVYLAAIGKGYGADQVARALEGLGIEDFMVEIGGDLYTSGVNPNGAPWRIGIESPDPLKVSPSKVVGVSGYGLASSGDYRNYFEKNGKRYSHVIDPATGRPINHATVSVTVLAKNAMFADAWATAMLILGKDRGLEIAEAQELAVLFVERDSVTGGLRIEANPRFEELVV
ncbi:MAG: FAD:protein FMN transferase [Pseudomonadota bacterium]